MVAPGPSGCRPLPPSPPPGRREEPPPPPPLSGGTRGRARTEWRPSQQKPSAPSWVPARRGRMDYLTTFTGKSGRLLRGTANRLWGFGGGGEARQVRFEDYLREPAQGDPGCGSPPHRPPAPSSPEGPGEPSLPSRPARPTRAEDRGVGGTAAGWAPREGARAGRALAGGPGRGPRRPSARSALGAEDLLGAASRLFLPCSSCFSAPGLDFTAPTVSRVGALKFFPPTRR